MLQQEIVADLMPFAQTVTRTSVCAVRGHVQILEQGSNKLCILIGQNDAGVLKSVSVEELRHSILNEPIEHEPLLGRNECVEVGYVLVVGSFA